MHKKITTVMGFVDTATPALTVYAERVFEHLRGLEIALFELNRVASEIVKDAPICEFKDFRDYELAKVTASEFIPFLSRLAGVLEEQTHKCMEQKWPNEAGER